MHQPAPRRRADPRRHRAGHRRRPVRECLYDSEGQLLNGSMADYLVPMAGEMPDIDVAHVETPTAATETRRQGRGEAGTAGAPAAVVNAINDALRAAERRGLAAADDARAHAGGARRDVITGRIDRTGLPVLASAAKQPRAAGRCRTWRFPGLFRGARKDGWPSPVRTHRPRRYIDHHGARSAKRPRGKDERRVRNGKLQGAGRSGHRRRIRAALAGPAPCPRRRKGGRSASASRRR